MDNDKFPRGWNPCWNSVYKAVKAGAIPKEAADMCPSAVAAFFNKNGCPGFEQGRQILDDLRVEDGQLNFGVAGDAEICAQCDDVAKSYAGTPEFNTAYYIMQAVKGLSLKMQAEGPLYGATELLLANQVVVEIVCSSFAAKLDDTKVMETFIAKSNNDLDKAHDSFYEWREEFQSLLPEVLKGVAQKLAQDSSGQTVKARPVRAPQRSTDEILKGWGRVDVLDEVEIS